MKPGNRVNHAEKPWRRKHETRKQSEDNRK